MSRLVAPSILFSQKTDKMLIAKCCKRKNIKKKAESAIDTFFAMEEDNNPLIIITCCFRNAKILFSAPTKK